MEKKLWRAPEVDSIEISCTEYESFTGTVVDGQYQDPGDKCKWKDAYAS